MAHTIHSLIKTEQQIEDMKVGGNILAQIMQDIKDYVMVGISTKQVDDHFAYLCEEYGVRSAFKGFEGYPANMCIDLNDSVVHGIASAQEMIEENDVVKLDIGIVYKGLMVDMSETVYFGEDSQVQKFIDTAVLARDKAIAQARQGNSISEVSKAMQKTVEKAGYSVVRELAGHGIGTHLHEAPEVPGFVDKHTVDFILLSGMTIAIEAIINKGSPSVYFENDGWGVKTADSSLSCIAEHTVLITDKDPVILTAG